jgi:AcrR family transcriptional regulator
MGSARTPAKAAKKRQRTRLEVDERRAQLLALGLEHFSARAYDEVSIDEIAEAAGISKGLIYHYFPTKRDFYAAVIRKAASDLLDRTVPDESLAPIDRLKAGLDAYLLYVERRGPAYSALLRGGIGSDAEVAAIVEETRQQFLARLVAGMPIAVPSAQLRTVLRGWIGFVEAASLDWVDHRDLDRTEIRELLAAILPEAVQTAVRLAMAPRL